MRSVTSYPIPWLSFLFLGVLLQACANLPGSGPDRDVLFEETFDLQSGGSWQLEADSEGRAEIIDGQLLLTIEKPATVQYVTLDNRVFADFIVDVEATQVNGRAGSSYGLLLRMAAPGQFYRFEITTNGEYAVERHDGEGSWTRLTDGWQESEAIVQGVNQTNTLRVAVVGNRFSFYANETLLTQVFDDNYTTGALALDAGTFNQDGLQVSFDNVVVTAP